MKKIISITIFSVLFFGLFSLPAFASVSYLRTPSGTPVLSPVNFTITLDSYNDLGCGSNDFWAIEIKSIDFNYYHSLVLASTSLSLSDDVALPNNDYTQVKFICCDNNVCNNYAGGNMPEYNGGEIIFSVISELPPVVGTLITLPEGFIGSTLVWVGNTFTDLAPLIAIFLGLPLAFWGISRVIGLFRISKVKKDD